jgi:putative ABC transport system permease protein
VTHLLRDFRDAGRSLANSPGVTAIAVLALALGIGVNTSSFTAVNTIVLHPLAYPHQERIMTLWESIPKLRAERDAVAPANFLDWQAQSTVFEQMAAYRSWSANLTGFDDPERIEGCLATPSFFALLGLKPMLGRTFLDEEAEPGRDGVVVVSRGFWQRRLASAADAVGRTISLNGRSYTVVGVMPEDFDYPLATDLWAPLALTNEEKNQRVGRTLAVLARLKPGIPVAKARADMETIGRRLEQRYPKTNEARGVLVTPLRELTNQVADRFVLILMSAAIFVLLLACANVANLQLARATGQQREIAVRAALGASRFQIARQLIAQTVSLSLLGGCLGLLLADWHVNWTRSSFPPAVMRWMAGMKNMRIDASVLVFTLAASIIAGVVCGLPAIWQLLRRTTGLDLNVLLKEGGRSSSAGPARGRLQNALVVTEVALALVLLVGAALMVKTFQRMLTINAGFNPKNLLTAEVSLPALKFRDDTQIRAFYGHVIPALETIPQAKSVAAVYRGYAGGLYIEGRPDPRPGEPWPEVRGVSSRYFQTMEVPVLRGRPISEQDGPEAPRVVVISESIARHYWPSADPLGRRVRLVSSDAPWLTVVGVCGDIKNWFTSEPMPRAYVPYLQAPGRSMTLLIRTAFDPMLATAAARAKVREADKNQPLYDVKSMEQNINDETSGVRTSASMMSMFAAIALLLAATGIYAVISYSVAQRTHEVGVRMALGAERADVLKMNLLGALRLGAIGLAIGIPAALAMTRLMSSVLFNVVAFDWTMFAGFTVVLACAALLAGYVPALRATKVDPAGALRHQ